MTIADLYQQILTTDYFDIGREQTSYRMQRVGHTMYMLFEWSHGATDWRHNLTYRPTKVTFGDHTIWVHRGLYQSYAAVRERIRAAITDTRIRRVLIGGYSHGAALAALTYADLLPRRQDIPFVGYGFGAPRVVWGAVPCRLFEGFYTVRCGTDIVTHLPPKLLGYRHVGELVKLRAVRGGPIVSHTPSAYTAALAADPFGAQAVFNPLCPLERCVKKCEKTVDLSDMA